MAGVQGPELSAEARGLLDPAWQLRWRAPEMALLFSDRALARARATGERALWLRAECVALFALNRTGRGVAAADRALAAVRDAEEAGDHEVAADLRVELACAARQVGGHEVAVRVLGPVLRRRDLPVAGRIHALVEFACSSAVGDERAEALDEAERLCGASGLERDTARVLRAQVSAASAGHSRREGQFDTAAEVAQSGLALLGQLGDPGADSGQFRASLALERVHALLELGRRAEAVRTAEPVLHEPVRAAAASPVGWLRYVLATRVHLLDGSSGAAVGLLGEAARSAEWFHLDDLLVEALSTLSHVHEENEDVERALHCLRRAHAADRRWRAAVHAARLRLNAEFPDSSEGSTAPAEPEPRRRHAPAPDSDVPVARAAASAGGGAAGSPAPEGPAAGGPAPVAAAPSAAPTSPAATEQAATGPAATGHPATGPAATGPAATGPAATGPAATGRAAGRVARTSTEEAIAAVEAMAGEQAGAHEQRSRRRAGGNHQDTREDAQEPPAWREPPAQGRRARHEPPRGQHEQSGPEQSGPEQPGRERTAAEERVPGNRVAGERAHAARAPQDRAPRDRAPRDRVVEERPHAEPTAAEPPREGPRSAEARTAQTPARAEQEPARFDTKDTNVRDAARRLMDALTGRSDQEGPDEAAAGDGVPEPRVPTGERPRSRAPAPSRHPVGSEVPTPPSALSTPSLPSDRPDSGAPGAPTFAESYRGEPEPGPELDDPAAELDDPALERDEAGLRIARGATEFPTAPKTFDDQGARSSREWAGSSAEPEHSDDAWLWQRSFHLPEDSSSRVSPEGAAAPTMPPLSDSSSRPRGSPGAGDPSLGDPSLDDSSLGDPGLGDPGLPAPGIAGSGVTEFEYAELDDPESDFAGSQYAGSQYTGSQYAGSDVGKSGFGEPEPDAPRLPGEGLPGPGRYDSGLSEREPARYEPAQHDPARYDPARYDAARHDVSGHDVPGHDTSEHGPSRYDESRYDEHGYGVPRYELSEHALPQPGRRSSRVDSEDPSWRDEEPGDVDLDRIDGEHLSDEDPGSYAEPGPRGGAVHGDSTYDGAGYDDEARARSGRTLAEIRESLRLLQERSGTATAAREAAAQPAAQFADPDLPLGDSPLGQSLLGDSGSGRAGNRRPSSDQRADDERASGQRAGGQTASDHSASRRSTSGQSTSDRSSSGQEAGGQPTSGQPTSGGRRRRRADPEDPLDDPGTESASDLLDRYRRWEPESASEDRFGAPAPEQVAPEQPAAEEPPAEPAEDAGLADLLAEALVAYESGRREPGEDDHLQNHQEPQNRRDAQNDRGAQPRRQPQTRGESQTHGQPEPRTAASSGRRHVEADAADVGVPVTRHLQESTSDGSGPGPSRRRRAAADRAPSYRSWTPPVEDNGPRRNFGP